MSGYLALQTLRAVVAVAREGNVTRRCVARCASARSWIRHSPGSVPFLKELVGSAPQIETALRQGMSVDVLAQVACGEPDVGLYLG
jgi:hypothetical protein